MCQSEIRVPPQSAFLIFGIYGCRGITYKQLKEFQSLKNDVCHTVVFGNIATVVASCKMLHWMQMADGSNVF